jgi:hypothetical protein
MFYSNEIRNFNDIPKGEDSRLTAAEFELAHGLVEKLSSEDFQPEAYEGPRTAIELSVLRLRRGRSGNRPRAAGRMCGLFDRDGFNLRQ